MKADEKQQAIPDKYEGLVKAISYDVEYYVEETVMNEAINNAANGK